MQEEKLAVFSNDEDRDDLEYHWNKVQTMARRLQSRGFKVRVGEVIDVTTTRLEVS